MKRHHPLDEVLWVEWEALNNTVDPPCGKQIEVKRGLYRPLFSQNEKFWPFLVWLALFICMPFMLVSTPDTNLLATSLLVHQLTDIPPSCMCHSSTPQPLLMDGWAPQSGLQHLFKRDPRCPRFGDGQWNLYFEALGAPEYAFRNLSSLAPEMAEHIQSREAAEQELLSFSAALRLALIADYGLSFRLGLQYSQINERLRYLNESEVRTVIKEILDEQGNVIGTDTFIEIGTRFKESYNHYRSLDIPLLLGYELRSQHTSVYFNAGILLNLIASQSGDILSPVDNTPISIDSNDPAAFAAFRQQLGLGWYASVGFTVRLGPGLDLIAEPYLKSFPRSITTDTYDVDQKYMNTGLFLGVRKQFRSRN
jgi:hypothetical protein